jgi:hypothetical protein
MVARCGLDRSVQGGLFYVRRARGECRRLRRVAIAQHSQTSHGDRSDGDRRSCDGQHATRRASSCLVAEVVLFIRRGAEFIEADERFLLRFDVYNVRGLDAMRLGWRNGAQCRWAWCRRKAERVRVPEAAAVGVVVVVVVAHYDGLARRLRSRSAYQGRRVSVAGGRVP